MTIQELMDRGATRAKKAAWADKETYLELPKLTGGGYGVWSYLRPGPTERRAFTEDELATLPPVPVFALGDDADWLDASV